MIVEDEDEDAVMDEINEGDDDLSEFLAEAIPGISDKSITNVIKVINKIDLWCEHLLEGRDDVGRLVKKADNVSDFIRQTLGYKESNTYRLRQCLRL